MQWNGSNSSWEDIIKEIDFLKLAKFSEDAFNKEKEKSQVSSI